MDAAVPVEAQIAPTGTWDTATPYLKQAHNAFEPLFKNNIDVAAAEVLASFSNVDGMPPAITANRFGKGRAIYVGKPAQPQIMGPLYRRLYASLGIEPGPKTPEGVYARVVQGRVLYVNTTGEAKDVTIEGTMSGVLGGRRFTNTLKLEPLSAELLEK